MAEPATILTPERPRISRSDVLQLSRRLGEPLERIRFREHALGAIGTVPYPDRVRHLWRYTDPAALLPGTIDLLAGTDGAFQAPRLADGGASAVMLAGSDPVVYIDARARRAGVRLVPLSHGGQIQALLGRAVPAQHGLFEAINAAGYGCGLLVHLPRGAVLRGPIHIQVPVATETSLTRLLIVADPGVEATVVEEHVGGLTGQRAIAVTEVHAAAGSQLRHVVLQSWSSGVAGHLTSRAIVDRDASLLTVLVQEGGSTAKLDIGAMLDGPGARSEIVGVTVGDGRQHLDLHTVHHHRSGQTWSNMDLRTALGGRAQAAYTGLIRIDENAALVEAYQDNRNLLLSSRARAETIPELEILNNDVSCTHGATVSPLDPEQLFYLHSRGIGPDAAVSLVVRGFLDAALRRIPETLRPTIEARVDGRLERLVGGGR